MEAYRVVFTDEALADLRQIRRYIADHNPEAASRIAVRIVAACDRLEYFPKRGRLGYVAGTRELVAVRPYIIVYRVDGDTVEILRVWHGAQNRT